MEHGQRRVGFYEKYIKTVQDKCLSLLALILLSPVLLVIAALVRLHLGSPVLFRQERAGKWGKPFYMYKFRTMRIDTPKDTPTHLLENPEKYITPVGKFLRKTSLDELPSLWNVVCGHCSLVGPRALYVKYIPRYTPEQARRLEVRPGITGLAQVSGRNAIDWETRFAYDVQYVDHITFIGDWKILLQTVGKVCRREGITSATSVTMEEFMGSEREEIPHE